MDSVEKPEHIISHQIFGKQPEPNEWMVGIQYRLALLFLETNKHDTVRFEMERLRSLAPNALVNLKHLKDLAAERPAAFRAEIQCLEDSLNLLKAPKDKQARSDVHIHPSDAIWDELDDETSEILDERAGFKREFSFCTQGLDDFLARRLVAVLPNLIHAMREEDTERGSLLREVRHQFVDINNESGLNFPSSLLAYAMTTWALTGSRDETVILLRRANDCTHRQPNCTHFTCRMLAHLYSLDGVYNESYKLVQAALDIKKTASTHVEAATYAVAIGDFESAKRHIESALNVRPSSIISMLNNPIILSIGLDLLDVVVKLQLRERKSAFKKCELWVQDTKKVLEAESLGDMELHIDRGLIDDAQPTLAYLDKADLIISSYATWLADHSRANLLTSSAKSIKSEHKRRHEALVNARKSVEAAWEARQDLVRQARAIQQQTVNLARQSMVQEEGKGEVAQRGCLMGVGTGCGAFTLYVVAFVVLGFNGLKLGVETFFGKIALIGTAIPVFIGLCIQLTYHMRRSAIDAQIGVEVAEAKRVFDEAVASADATYKEQIEGLHSILAEKEVELKKIDESLRYINNRIDATAVSAA